MGKQSSNGRFNLGNISYVELFNCQTLFGLEGGQRREATYILQLFDAQ